MKAKVIRKFRDKYTNEIYQRGQVLELTEARYKEIMLKGKFVFRIAADDAVAPVSDDANKCANDTEETPENAADALTDGFDAMSMRELKEYADKTYKLTFGRGTKKAEIIEALRRMEQGGK